MFIVKGSGQFPYDMLRFDECWPYQSSDANKINTEENEIRTIRLCTSNLNAPTRKRWESFTWKVVNEVMI